MNLFNTLKDTIASTWSKKVKSHKSLKAIMEAIDFNVYRYRRKTGKGFTGPRGGKQEQRQYMDSMVISLPKGYKLYALNIDQFAQKCNIHPDGKKVLSSNNWFPLNKLPLEIVKDLGAKQNEKRERVFNKSGYAAWIEKDGKIEGLRKTKYNDIKLESTPSKKMIYRRYRDGSLEESFIKVLGAYIVSTVVNNKNETLLDIDIDPKDYSPSKENSEKEKSINKVLLKETSLDESITDMKLHDFDLEPVKNLSKEEIWKLTNGTGGITSGTYGYKKLVARFWEPITIHQENHPGDRYKSLMQWVIKGKKGEVITIYDREESLIKNIEEGNIEEEKEAIKKIQDNPESLYSVGGNITKKQTETLFEAIGLM